jgi:bromodomain-containing factor 1
VSLPPLLPCFLPSYLYPYLSSKLGRNANHNETNLDSSPAPSSHPALNKTPEISSANKLASSSVGVNGVADTNIHSYSSNQTINMAPLDPPTELQPTEESSVAKSSTSQYLDTNITPTDLPSLANTPDELPTVSAIGSAIEAAVEDSAPSSTVPPVVEAQESDLRDSTSSMALPQDASAETHSLPEPLAQDSSTAGENLSTQNQANANENSVPDFNADASKTSVPEVDANANDLSRSYADQQFPQSHMLDSSSSTSMQAVSDQELPAAPTMDPQDTEMADAPQPSPAKVSRGREDDNEIEPSAKRTKTDDDEGPSGALLAPDTHSAIQNGDSVPAGLKSEGGPITEYESKEIIKIIKNSLRTTGGKNFRAPVAILWPNFADQYLAKVTDPIDLGTIENNVKEKKYRSMDDFKAHVQLLYDNAVLFNGVDHDITRAAASTRDSILSKVATIPAEPAAVPKIPKKSAKRSTPVADPAPRAKPAPRQSRSGANDASPAAPPAQTFALDPATNTPLIRRDSTKNETGRPKREIHPPKNKDLPYNVRPKSKKFATELRFCEEALNELKKPKNFTVAQHFLTPVDPVALNIPNYHTVIKNPMDISTVAKKLQTGAYERAKNFESDVRLIFSNCFKFNPPGNPVRELGKQLESVFDEKWGQKDQWISEHTPAALSPGSSADTDDEESEGDDEEPQPPVQSNNEFKDRLVVEQKKLIELMTAKKPDQAQIALQKQIVDFVQGKIDEEAAKAVAVTTKKAPKKAKASKAVKKAAPAKKASAPAKKASTQRKKYLGTLEKETISNGISELPETVSEIVLEMIKADRPDVAVSKEEMIVFPP